MAKVEIDEGSGFCFGVVTAINKAEEELTKGGTLYCLGDIVHNSREVERLKAMGLITINHEEFNRLHEDICTIMDMNYQSVRNLMHRGITRLRELVG